MLFLQHYQMVSAQDISNDLLRNNVLIDLAADFRLNKASDYLKWYKQKHRSVKFNHKKVYISHCLKLTRKKS